MSWGGRQVGWECPRCTKIHAPWVPDCHCNGMGAGTGHPVSPHFMVCLKCHATYGMGQFHKCSESEKGE